MSRTVNSPTAAIHRTVVTHRSLPRRQTRPKTLMTLSRSLSLRTTTITIVRQYQIPRLDRCASNDQCELTPLCLERRVRFERPASTIVHARAHVLRCIQVIMLRKDPQIYVTVILSE
jgi:hypothetical protein